VRKRPRTGVGSPHLCTPEELLSLVRQVAPIRLDPCSNRWSRVKATVELAGDPRKPHDDGLEESWRSLSRGGQAYVNPPYGPAGTLDRWARKAVLEGEAGTTLELLTPDDATTVWYRQLWRACDRVVRLTQRIRFTDGGRVRDSAMFGSALWLFTPSLELCARFESVYEERGIVIDPARASRRRVSRARIEEACT